MKPQIEIAKALDVEKFHFDLNPTIYWEVNGQKFKAELKSTSKSAMNDEIKYFVAQSKLIGRDTAYASN